MIRVKQTPPAKGRPAKGRAANSGSANSSTANRVISQKQIARRLWKPAYFLRRFLLEDRSWGEMRMMATIAMIVLCMVIFSLLLEQAHLNAVRERLILKSPALDIVPDLVLETIITFFTRRTLRYLLVPLAGILLSFLGGALFLQDLYELPSLGKALKYIQAAAYSMDYPRMSIENGEKKLGEAEINLLDRIGGPGYLYIAPGNVVLFERLGGLSNVRGAGYHFIPRHETIKEIACLDDQHGSIESATAATKDGIEVTVRDIQFRFRLRLGRKYGDYTLRTPENPYPYSVQAVRNMAYNRFVNEKGLSPWYNGVRLAVESAITDYINQHQLDHLTTPSDEKQDPREEIRARVNSPAVRERLKGLGAELLWFDIGQFECTDKRVVEQRLDTWSARWAGAAKVERAQGEAYMQALREQGRAEGHQKILKSILQAFNQSRVPLDSKQNSLMLLLSSTAQVLNALSNEQEEPPPPKRLPKPKA